MSVSKLKRSWTKWSFKVHWYGKKPLWTIWKIIIFFSKNYQRFFKRRIKKRDELLRCRIKGITLYFEVFFSILVRLKFKLYSNIWKETRVTNRNNISNYMLSNSFCNFSCDADWQKTWLLNGILMVYPYTIIWVRGSIWLWNKTWTNMPIWQTFFLLLGFAHVPISFASTIYILAYQEYNTETFGRSIDLLFIEWVWNFLYTL